MTFAVAAGVIKDALTRKRNPMQLYSYQCALCGFVHLTSQKPRKPKHWTDQYGMKHHQSRTA